MRKCTVTYRSRMGSALLLTLASLACSSTHEGRVFDRGPGLRPVKPLVRLTRSGVCLGRCPTYSVEVDIEGGVTYSGGSNVMTVGPATGRMAPEALHQLRAVMEKASRAKMPAEHCACGCATHTPYVYLTTWDKNDVSKTFMYDEGCERAPHAVRVLEDAVDLLVDIERWIGTHQQRRLCFEEQRDCSALVGVPEPP